MKKIKTWLMGSGLLAVLLTLSGCVRQLPDGTPDTTGIIYRFLVQPMSYFLTYIADNLNLGYGLAIITLTIIVRLIILPLGINQSRKSMIQSEKMQYLKPQVDAAQQKAKEAKTREEQMQAQMEMQQVYKDNNVSMLGGMGCLPLLVQMPIFTALFYTMRSTPGMIGATFGPIHLDSPNLILVAVAGIAYIAQGYISMIGIPDEQKKTMRSMLIVSPLMIVVMSISAPAGLTLYWVVGGVFSCIQTFITNVIMKPRIRAQVTEEMKKNPPKTVVTPRKDVTPTAEAPKVAAPKNGQGRNAGKQKNRN
ncbi:membrane protein insertase YidC [Enterococcus olivae]